jgi:hypothetical protein
MKEKKTYHKYYMTLFRAYRSGHNIQAIKTSFKYRFNRHDKDTDSGKQSILQGNTRVKNEQGVGSSSIYLTEEQYH